MTESPPEDDKPSKSQRKREMDALKDLAARLVTLPQKHLAEIIDADVRESIATARKITRGNAKKRQIQYIAKLLSRVDTEPYQKIIDTLDAGSAEYVKRFHKLEQWREQLMNGDDAVMAEVLSEHPSADRQQLRQLIRSAISERDAGRDQIYYRRLFQFLKTLDVDDNGSTGA